MKIKILFVCMGNICRSPTAEAVFRAKVKQLNLLDQFDIDSAGTHDYHIGDAPDHRTQLAAKRRGYDLSALRGRQIHTDDFFAFDYVLAMDKANLSNLMRLQPNNSTAHLGLFLPFAEACSYSEVPDPYYGGAEGFEQVLDLVEVAADGLLAHIQTRHFI